MLQGEGGAQLQIRPYFQSTQVQQQRGLYLKLAVPQKLLYGFLEGADLPWPQQEAVAEPEVLQTAQVSDTGLTWPAAAWSWKQA